MKELIEKLCEIPGPSGHENAIREAIQKEVAPFADSMEVDALGNLIVHKGARGKDGLRIMLSAHMDELGIIVTHVDKKGFVRFTTIGGVYVRYLAGSRVLFLNGVKGTINHEPAEEPSKIPSMEEFFIDVGATSPADCPVKVGDLAVFDRPFMDLGSRFMSKALDDRVSCAVLIETLRQIKQSPNELLFVFSVQEEVGVRGAITAAYSIDPDLGIAVDVTGTGDTPGNQKMEVALGGGAAIKIRDQGMLCDPKVIRWMRAAAEKAGIKHQMEILRGGTTDAYQIQVNRAGVPTGAISIPCRYIHSPSEMADIHDLENSVKLLVTLISGPVHLK
jgi:endoglucanase